MLANWTRHLKRVVLSFAVALAIVFSGASNSYAKDQCEFDKICETPACEVSQFCGPAPNASPQPGIR